MSQLTDYQANYQTVIVAKPQAASIANQNVRVEDDGRVTVQFTSTSQEDVIALRDWLSELIEETE